MKIFLTTFHVWHNMFYTQVSIPHLEKTCSKKTISLPQVRFKQINVKEIIVFEHMS